MKNALNINKRRFLTAGGLGFGGLGVLLITLFSTGTAFAAFPLTGIGGFVVSATDITGTNFKQYPAVGQSSEKQMLPEAAIELDSSTIKGLNLSKDLDVSSQLGPLGISKVRVVITADGDVTGGGMKMRVSGLTADMASFSNLDIEEHYDSDPLKKLDLQAPSLHLTNAQLNTHSLLANTMNIPNMKFKILPLSASGGVLFGDF
ncbi:DUF6230 family protein [Aneurinibacillus terranovensis]|uniref:DUF6230 family protein n=1 Tax=Aneurinibacillus terranovensis TaxID=278991 RepID=UPI00040D5104|nr:DUF6230 family protein [Aneurinibacillus terranovensis]